VLVGSSVGVNASMLVRMRVHQCECEHVGRCVYKCISLVNSIQIINFFLGPFIAPSA
jgi:hypothetical protein